MLMRVPRQHARRVCGLLRQAGGPDAHVERPIEPDASKCKRRPLVDEQSAAAVKVLHRRRRGEREEREHGAERRRGPAAHQGNAASKPLVFKRAEQQQQARLLFKCEKPATVTVGRANEETSMV